jgi:hypothetical protein
VLSQGWLPRGSGLGLVASATSDAPVPLYYCVCVCVCVYVCVWERGKGNITHMHTYKLACIPRPLSMCVAQGSVQVL